MHGKAVEEEPTQSNGGSSSAVHRLRGSEGHGPRVARLCSSGRQGREAWVWQAVTDPLFEPLTRLDDDIELLPLHDAVERILLRAEARDRLIVAWSEHELDVVKEYCPKHLARFEARYVNARIFAVYWRNACHDRDKPATRDLPTYFELIGYDLPDDLGPGRAGETIRRVGKALEKGRGIAGLTDDQRLRWQQLRDHNLHDCHGMKKVCVLAAAEVAAR